MNQKRFLTLSEAKRIAAAREAGALSHQLPLTTAVVGGVPNVVDGHRISGFGVSGGKSSDEAQLARAGIAALSA